MTETKATSPYLNRPRRTPEQALADHKRRKHRERLLALATRLEQRAENIAQVGMAIDQEQGYAMRDDAAAIRWALGEIGEG